MRIGRRIRGDTIVEVMLAVAVTSTVLAGSFVAVSRSLKATRAAQERGEAIKVAEAQIERLKYLNVKGANTDIYTKGGPYCINPSLVVVDVTNISDTAGDPCDNSDRYVASITRDATTGIHEIRILWPNATGGSSVAGYPGYDEIKMYYRVYQ